MPDRCQYGSETCMLGSKCGYCQRDEAFARIAALEKLLTECKAYIAHTHWPGCTALKSTIDDALAGGKDTK